MRSQRFIFLTVIFVISSLLSFGNVEVCLLNNQYYYTKILPASNPQDFSVNNFVVYSTSGNCGTFNRGVGGANGGSAPCTVGGTPGVNKTLDDSDIANPCPIDDYISLMLLIAGGTGFFFLRRRLV